MKSVVDTRQKSPALFGVLAFSNILNYLLYAYPIQTKSTFIGLILSSIPKLLKDVNNKCKFKLRFVIYLIISLSIGILTVVLEKYMGK